MASVTTTKPPATSPGDAIDAARARHRRSEGQLGVSADDHTWTKIKRHLVRRRAKLMRQLIDSGSGEEGTRARIQEIEDLIGMVEPRAEELSVASFEGVDYGL